MVTITNTALRHTVYQNVYDVINNSKGSYGASGTPTIYGGLPDFNDITFPAIVIMPVEVSEDSILFDTVYNTSKTILVTVMCFAKGNKDTDYLGDGVSSALRSSMFSGVTLVNVSDDNSYLTPNDQKVKVKTLGFTYIRR
jgi:hypothetical protein